MGCLQPPDPARREHALRQPPEDTADADVHFEDGEDVALAVVVDAHGDVVDAHHFAAGDVDDLLVQQIAADAQEALVVVVGHELLVAQLNAPAEGDGTHLIVADGEPGVSSAHQEAVDARGVERRHQGGILHPPDAPAFEVQHRHGHQFGKKQEVRHRKRPGAGELERDSVRFPTGVLPMRSTQLCRRHFQYGASTCKPAREKCGDTLTIVNSAAPRCG